MHNPPPDILLPSKRTLSFQNPTPHIMGILNVTPDSFSDGGLHSSPERALQRALTMIDEGATILDIGGESTRPGADPVSLDEELQRVIPVIEKIRQHSDVLISCDTTKAHVAHAAVQAGADIINDVSGLQHDPAMLQTAINSRAAVVIMHMRGTPQTMQTLTDYDDVVHDVVQTLQQRAQHAHSQGLPSSHILLDPGIGFSKTTPQNLLLLRHLDQLCSLGYPILLGTSRKSFIGALLHEDDPSQRLEGTLASVALGTASGAHILRVHDVRACARTARVAAAIAHAH